MKVELIPHSQATNSYGLLEDVIKAIEEEPKRFYWGNWVSGYDNPDVPSEFKPACGTIGCVHGWIDLLTAHDPSRSDGGNARLWFPEIGSVQQDLYKLAYASGDYNGLEEQPDEDEDSGGWIHRQHKETQEEYAARAARAIRLFMSRHEQELRNHRIQIPDRKVS